MPKKLASEISVPSLVQERLATWGRVIHAQRVRQRMTAAGLAERMLVSLATVRRLERGDSGAAVSAYLTALLYLGVIDEAAPALAASLWSHAPGQRVKPTRVERAGADSEYF